MIFGMMLSEAIVLLLLGLGFNWVAGKSRGKNAREAFRFWAWAAWLPFLTGILLSLLLMFVPLPLGWLIFFLKYAPSAVAVWLGMRSMLKEMRAQKVGDYTEAA